MDVMRTAARVHWLPLILVALLATSCLKARALRPYGLPPGGGGGGGTTEKNPGQAVPGFTFASGGSYLTTGGEYLLHSTIRQVGRPIVLSGGDYTLLPGQQGSHYVPSQ